jgi:RimJ/RimL family protein N-acetyltransferase
MAVRKLTQLDKTRIINHLTQLQGEDRRLRFGGTVNDDYISTYVTKSFEQESQWFGVDHIDGHLVATCHVAILDGEAELGCCVDEDYRGEGFAQKMFDRAVTWLRVRNITHVFMHCLSENGAMKHIARKNDMVLVSEYGETDAAVDVQPATPVTYMEEAYMNRMAFYDMYMKNNYRVFDFYWNRRT